MMKPLVTIIIPTFNRPTCVALFLERLKQAQASDIELFRFDFYDSGASHATEELFQNLPDSLKDQVGYHHLPTDIDTDDKVITAFHEVKTPYVYLVGDGYLLDFKALKALFLARQEAGDDVILLAPSKNPNYASYLTQKGHQGNRPILYVDTRAFFKDFYWLVILYGATLIKKEIIDNLFAKKLDEKYRHCNFAYPDYLFEYGVDHRLQASVQMSEAIDYNPEKKEGGWETKDQALAIWSKQLCHSFDLLPDFYNPLKASTLLAIGQTTGFFTKKGLLHLRAKRFVSLSLYHRYKPELKRTVKPFRFLFFVCLLPAWPLKVVFALRAKRHLRQQPTK